MLDRDRDAPVAHPLLPAEPHARLDREARADVGWQDLVAVGLWLRLEDLPAGHRDDPRRRPVGGERAAGFEREPDLCTRPDENQVRRGARLPERVGTLLEARRRREL